MPNALAVVCRLNCHRWLSSTQLPKILNARLCRILLGVGIHFLRLFLSIPLVVASRVLGVHHSLLRLNFDQRSVAESDSLIKIRVSSVGLKPR